MSYSTANAICFQPLLTDDESFVSQMYSDDEKELSIYLDTAWSLMTPDERRMLSATARTGRRGYNGFSIFAVLMTKMFYRCDTVRSVLQLFRKSWNLMHIAGLDSVPSEASMSRRISELMNIIDIGRLHERLVVSYYKDRLVHNTSLDSTIIDCHEKPLTKEKKQPLKRGRKRKGSEEELQFIARKEDETRQSLLLIQGDPHEALASLEHRCSITGKKNSHGNMEWHIGYKAHMLVDDRGIPISCHVTGACVNDMKPAIPLIRIADSRCNFLYCLMDAGYCWEEIRKATHSLGKVPVIDTKKDHRGNKGCLDPPKKDRYKARTTVERSNSELKACFLPDCLHSRGAKAILDICVSMLLLTMKRMRMVLLEEQRWARKRTA